MGLSSSFQRPGSEGARISNSPSRPYGFSGESLSPRESSEEERQGENACDAGALRGAVAKLISARQRLAQPPLRDKRYRRKKWMREAGRLTVSQVPNATGKLGCKVFPRHDGSTSWYWRLTQGPGLSIHDRRTLEGK